MSDRPPDDTPARFPRQAPVTPMSLRRANVLAQLDIQRDRSGQRDPIAELHARIERLEAALYEMATEVRQCRHS
jgi:hypothetical protein